MKDVILLAIGFVSGVLVTAALYEKAKAFVVGLLTKTASKIEGK